MTEMVYCYDGSFEGFLCCVFDSYANREALTAICRDEDFVPTLFASRMIPTDRDHAGRVYRKVVKCSPWAAELLRKGFLTCLPDREIHLYNLVQKLLQVGPGFLGNLSDPVLYPVAKAGNPDGTIVNALLHHCGDLSGIGGVERPGIVHRLDKDTSGCLVIAKNDGAHQSLTAQFAARSTEKRYLAVIQGIPSQSSGTVFTHIGRHPVNRLKMAVVNPGSGKAAITDYDLLCADPSTDSSLVLCTLHTGRTHQIRVHMLHLGHPLIGDPIYAKPARQKAKPGRLMLHAWRLGFDHPRTGKRMDFEAPVPPEYTPWLQLFPNGLYGAIPEPRPVQEDGGRN